MKCFETLYGFTVIYIFSKKPLDIVSFCVYNANENLKDLETLGDFDMTNRVLPVLNE